MVISARPAVDPANHWALHLKVWTTDAKFAGSEHNMRTRVFLVDGAGQPQAHWACDNEPEGEAPHPTDLCNKTSWPLPGGQQAHGYHVIVPVLSGSTNPGEVVAVTTIAWDGPMPDVSTGLGWELSTTPIALWMPPGSPEVALAPAPGGVAKQPLAFHFTAQDEDGVPLRLDDSELRFAFPGCYEEPSGLGPEPCAIAGTDERVQLSAMADGSHQVMVSLPDSFYPPEGAEEPVRFGLRVEAAGLAVAERPAAFEVRASPPRTAVVLAIDEGEAMAAPERLAGAKVAAELILRSLGDEDAAAVVSFGRDAFTLQGLGSFCDELSDGRQAAIAALESLDPAGCTSLGDGLLEAQSILASALDESPVAGPLAACLPDRQLVVVLSAADSNAGYPAYANYAPLDGRSPASDGSDADPSCGPDDDRGDNEPWYAGELRRPERAALGLPVPAIAAVAVAGEAEADELQALVHAAGGRSSLGSAGAAGRREVPLALRLSDAARAQVGAAMGYERVASFYADSPHPADMPWLEVEAGAGELLVSVACAGADVSGLELVAPSGLHHLPASAGPRAAVFRVEGPEAGGWAFAHGGPVSEVPLGGGPTVFVEEAVTSALRMVVSADSAGRLPVAVARGAYETGRYAGAPVALRAILSGPIPMAQGARVEAVVTSPLGVSERLTLHDDGQHDDGDANDGVYGATYLDTLAAGAYHVRFVALGPDAVTGGSVTRERALAFALHDGEDSDRDGLPDWWERMNGAGLEDQSAEDDLDHDGLDALEEYAAHTSPRLSDSDGGGEEDGSEVARGADPLSDEDDGIYAIDPLIAPGNEKGLVGLSVPMLMDAFVEIERGPSAQGPFEPVYAGELTEDGMVADPAENDVTVCYRTRTSFGEVVSGWSYPQCVLPRIDPYAPSVALEVASVPAPGDTEAVVRIAVSDTPGGSSPLAPHPLAVLVDPEAELSGVVEMLVWTDAGFEAGWQPYQRELTVTLVDPAFTPVYAKVRDGAGNESKLASLVVAVRDRWPGETLVGFDGVVLEPHAVVAGSVAVVNDDEAPLPGGAELLLGAWAELQGDARASGVLIGQGSVVAGSLVYDEIEGLGLVHGELRTPLSTPVPLLLPDMPSVPTDGPSVTVSKNETSVLAPGSYGAVELGAGSPDKRAVLTLAGGSYGMRSLTLGSRARLECAAACTVLVAEALTAGNAAEIAPASADVLGAQVALFVARAEDLDDAASVRLGPNAKMHGRISAPAGTIWLEQGTTAAGTFLGKRVRVGPGARVAKDGG